MKYIPIFEFPVSLTVQTALADALRESIADYRAMGSRYPRYRFTQRQRVRDLVEAIRSLRAAKVCHGDPTITDNYTPILERATS